MKPFYYNAQQLLPVSIDVAWDFFSSPRNLALITPPELSFRILTPLEKTEIYEGMIINYKVRPLFGIELRWQTEISGVDKPTSFIDRQVAGPYKTWEHTHTFIEAEGGTLVVDHVKYVLPFGLVGQLGHRLIVRKKIEKIFKYRSQVLTNIFSNQ
jgi:ligand-binding SRPBCC domain-containing protein